LISSFVGAVRERPGLIIAYIVFLVIIIIMQFGFGIAAGTVASGSAPEASGPFVGALNENYMYFDWKTLDSFFPPSCYYAQANATVLAFMANVETNYTFSFPACDFYGKCSNGKSAQEIECCVNGQCNFGNSNCDSGNDCVMKFLGKIAAPVAVVAFLSLCIEIAALVLACIIRPGPIKKYGV